MALPNSKMLHADTHGDETRERDRPKVLFIGGYGRSGSTLLDRLLGSIPGFVSVGELRYLWEWGLQKNLLCACGSPIRECPFWSKVIDTTFDHNELDVEQLLWLKSRVEQVVTLRSVVLPNTLLGRKKSLFDEYSRIVERLYRAIQLHAGCRFIVDSSKHPSRAAILSELDGIELNIVHLIRDCRAVAYSWQRKRARPEIQASQELMDIHGTLRSVSHWIGHNRLIASLKHKAARYKLLRYEDLVSNPDATLQNLLAWMGEPRTELSFLGGDAVLLSASHTVAGNPMRFQSGAVPLKSDDEWRHQFGVARKLTVASCTWPLLIKYGYPLWV